MPDFKHLFISKPTDTRKKVLRIFENGGCDILLIEEGRPALYLFSATLNEIIIDTKVEESVTNATNDDLPELQQGQGI